MRLFIYIKHDIVCHLFSVSMLLLPGISVTLREVVVLNMFFHSNSSVGNKFFGGYFLL